MALAELCRRTSIAVETRTCELIISHTAVENTDLPDGASLAALDADGARHNICHASLRHAFEQLRHRQQRVMAALALQRDAVVGDLGEASHGGEHDGRARPSARLQIAFGASGKSGARRRPAKSRFDPPTPMCACLRRGADLQPVREGPAMRTSESPHQAQVHQGDGVDAALP